MSTFQKRISGAKERLLTPARRTAVQNGLFALWITALGALLSGAELIFGVRPFGVALAAGAAAYFPAALAGSALYALLTKDRLTLITLLITGAARLVTAIYLHNGAKKEQLFGERFALRALFAALPLLGTGLYRLIAGEFRFFDLFGLLLATAAGALSAFLYAGAFEKKDVSFPHSREAGIAALALTAVFAMRTVQFFGVYPSAVAAALLAFLLVAHRGVSFGAVGGLLAGLCFDYRLAPAFLLCGLCFGLLEKSSRGGALLAGGGAAVAYAFAVMRAPGITLLLPSLLTAGALFLAGDSAGLVEGSQGYRLTQRRRRAATQLARAEQGEEGEARLRSISDALGDLSGTFFEIGNRLRRPGQSDLKHVCDRAFNDSCPSCQHRDTCWGSDYRSTATALSELCSYLQQNGSVNAEKLPAALVARCTQLPHILGRINEQALQLSQEALRGDKTSVVASDYALLSRMMCEALEGAQRDFKQDEALGERIQEHLTRLGYTLECATVCGTDRRRVILRGIRLPGRHLKLRELRLLLEQHCHLSLAAPKASESDGALDLVFLQRKKYESKTVKSVRAKGRGEGRYCGDSAVWLSAKGDRNFALLCDGMGSGRSAALTSAIASNFLSRILQAGTQPETALRLLNGFLSARGLRENENSTTVDLLEIDCVSGKAALYKCGAASTFLLRDGAVTRFSSRTAPVGILETLDAERLRFEVQEGDVVVQVSDGITGGDEDCPWLCRMLTEKWDGDAERFARMALNHASSKVEDDLSILITEIGKSPATGEESPTQKASA